MGFYVAPDALLDKIGTEARAAIASDDPHLIRKALLWARDAAEQGARAEDAKRSKKAAAEITEYLDLTETKDIIAALARRFQGVVVIGMMVDSKGEEKYSFSSRGGPTLNRGMLAWAADYMGAFQVKHTKYLPEGY